MTQNSGLALAPLLSWASTLLLFLALSLSSLVRVLPLPLVPRPIRYEYLELEVPNKLDLTETTTGYS